MSTVAMERLVVGWNRDCFDLRSDEMLAQVMDRGDLVAWRELYALAVVHEGLRHRLHAIVRRVPLPFPHFWLAALASLGEPVDWNAPLPLDPGLA